jgi:hypothetical protein
VEVTTAGASPDDGCFKGGQRGMGSYTTKNSS